MGSVAHIDKNGQVIKNENTQTVDKKGNTALDKEDFLQLLVAEMKYQDPLEPTSNTEYIAQYATFAEVEQLQNMAGSMESQAALSLTGKYVTVSITDGATQTGEKSGRVEYVEKSGKDFLLYIDGEAYNYANLETVWDEGYLEAYDLCSSWADKVAKYKDVSRLTPDDADTIADLRSQYEEMSAYQKSFIGSSLIDILEAAEDQMKVLGV